MSTGITRVRTSASPAAVFAALTTADDLRVWLAEHADVDLEQGVYEFWGRYTPEGERGRHKLLGVTESSVRFSWFLHGTEYTIELGVEERDGQTLIVASQSPFPDWGAAIEDEGKAGVVQTFWSLSLANLVEHVENRPVFALCDFSTPEQKIEVDIAAEPAAIIHALTDPDVFARYFGARCAIEPHVGGRWTMGSSFDEEAHAAKILALDEERFTLEFPDGMVADWQLKGSEGKTRLTFVQSGFDVTDPPYGGWLGWLSGFADMRRMLELPSWRPMWHSYEAPGLPDGVLVLE
ncbi:SRPBCC family protein [Lentzea sp. NPDC058450]|uniref:SRPBCC family protein n=1 Tax=Lentzea sp. NPDC058450 TaxID=3346505 RepID=UPI0036641309